MVAHKKGLNKFHTLAMNFVAYSIVTISNAYHSVLLSLFKFGHLHTDKHMVVYAQTINNLQHKKCGIW